MQTARRRSRSLAEHRSALRRFLWGEDGSAIVFAMTVLLMMAIVGGMAVDFMRFETRRAAVQSALDRAVLAAADLGQTLPPEEVVRDFMRKEGLIDQVQSITVTANAGARRIEASADVQIETMFLDLVGMDEVAALISSAAMESISDIEVSMVLDISGSMYGYKLENLKVAADQFLDILFDQTAAGGLLVSLVPYSTQVNPGPDLAAQYNIVRTHANSDCVDFPTASYSTTALDPSDPIEQVAHFDADAYGVDFASIGPYNFECRVEPNNYILPFSQDEAALRAHVQGLTANNWTSIEMGTKWGAALLDPTSRPVARGLATAGLRPNSISSRPMAWNAPVLKAMVIMTDGENTLHRQLAEPYRSGLSDVWHDAGTYYVEDPEPGDYDMDGVSDEAYYRPDLDAWTNDLAGTQLTWPELFSMVSVDGHAYVFRYGQTQDSAVYQQWYDGLLSYTYTEEKDVRLDAICTAAKTAGIVIFTIGVEVSDRSALVLESCASSPAHFFRVEAVEMVTAFSSIANQINALRLIQ